MVDKFDNDVDRYEYLRLLRAQLSNSEQCLIAFNCAYGEGRIVFKGLVERFALLHNIHDDDRQMLDLEEIFEPGAFVHAVQGEAL